MTCLIVLAPAISVQTGRSVTPSLLDFAHSRVTFASHQVAERVPARFPSVSIPWGFLLSNHRLDHFTRAVLLFSAAPDAVNAPRPTREMRQQVFSHFCFAWSSSPPRGPLPASPVAPPTDAEFLLATHVPANSCTSQKRHGRITHQPEDVPYGGLDPDLSCNPPLSHGSSRFDVDDRRTRGFQAPTGSGASLFYVKHCGM